MLVRYYTPSRDLNLKVNQGLYYFLFDQTQPYFLIRSHSTDFIYSRTLFASYVTFPPLNKQNYKISHIMYVISL